MSDGQNNVPGALGVGTDDQIQSNCGTMCGKPDDMFMLSCGKCSVWCHYSCVGVDEDVEHRDWSCENCASVAAQIQQNKASTPETTVSSGTEQNPTAQQQDPNHFQQQLLLLQRQITEQQKQLTKLTQEKETRMNQPVNQQPDRSNRGATVPGDRPLGRNDTFVADSSLQLCRRTGQGNTWNQIPGRGEYVPDRRRTDTLPKASSTTIHTPRANPPRTETPADRLARDLQLMEEKHAMERRQLEERYRLLDEYEGQQRGNRRSTVHIREPENDLSSSESTSAFEHELSRSQLAARQAVNRDLPPFSGDPQEWPLFYASYENSTRMCAYSDEENLLRLQRSLRGKALDAVRSRLLHPSSLPGVISTLRTLFGRPEVIVHSLVNRIREMPHPRADKLQTLIDFGVAVQNVCSTIMACELDEYLYNVALLQELVDKLPPTIKLNWAIYKQELGFRVKLSDFGDWLEKLVEAACSVTIPQIGHSSKVDRRGNFVNVHSESSDNVSSGEFTPKPPTKPTSKECVVCRGDCCGVDTCKKFRAMDVGSRWDVLKEHKLCKKCLRKHFGACQSKTPCGKNGCSYMHNQLLHDDARYKRDAVTERTAPASQESTSQSCNTHLASKGKVLFRYVPVVIHGKGVSVKTYAFLDDGSSATFMEHSLWEELKLDGSSHHLCLNWTAGQQRDEKDSVKLTLKISGVHNTHKTFVLPKVHTVQNLALPAQTLSMPELSSQYEYLQKLPVDSYESVSPRILIGIDNCRLGHALNSREGDQDQPVAAKTRLGWIVYGPCATGSAKPDGDYSAYHSFHICACGSEADSSLDTSLKEYFSFDSMGIYQPSTPLLSKDDERAYQLLRSNTCLKNGRYETGLLWRFNNITLPDSRSMAMKRLECLEKRMKREPQLAEMLREKISDYLQKGYMRKLTPEEAATKHPREWYLPIFPVTNPNKPGKIRIVWDAAATVGRVSLNTFLLPGPDQLASLLSVLLGFREFKFGVVADLREMFHQVVIREEDQHCQRILWRDGHSEREPDVFVMQRMTFGASCSPSCAQFVKNLNADRFQEQHPRAVECIQKEHYVDDMLTSVETEEEAVRLAEDVQFIHRSGGFELRNWLSNSRKVLENQAESWTAEKSLNFESEVSTEKVLGMWWDVSSDAFTFKLSSRHDQGLLSGSRIPTKREMLRTLMTIYDPLGLLASFLMFLKILLQEVWRSGTGWDDKIPSELVEKWRMWLQVLPQVERVRVPRCYRQLTTATNDNNIQLHVFVDASEKGIAAVAYLRFEQNGVMECAMVGAKTRVAPLKYLSIPRLELQAAVIGTRLAKTIGESLRLKPSQRFFWSDSRDVICWLRSDHRRYSQYVAFRVGEILEASKLQEWKWVSTKINVADEGTKWQKTPDLSPNSRWFRGPDFLWMKESDWPQDTRFPGTTTNELRLSVLHHSIYEPLMKFENFSKWKVLLRTAAYVYRFSTNLRRRISGQPGVTGPLRQEELKLAEQVIHRQLQQEAFPDEVKLLAEQEANPTGRSVIPKTSVLFKLSPMIDEHGVLRLRGRIDACQFAPDSMKRPVLLPKRSHVTDLVIADFHVKYRHLNHATAMNEIRQKYYIPQLQSGYNRVRRNCQMCKLERAEPQPPEMAELPAARLAAFARPFSYTGVDYFGPMQVVVGKRVEKRWGVLLTCLTVRAVHMELAHSLTTDSCILSLRNFISRRGTPIEIVSDRGTNFVGAERELRQALEKVNQEEMMEAFVTPDTKWTFNPPASPHFGGSWERLVQSVKKVLNKFKPSRLPSDEILRNMLAEIEMMLNSRPLTHIPLDDETSCPLTPNHFLLGSSNGSKPPIAFDDGYVALKHSWSMSQVYANEFWSKWVAEYLPTLTRRTRWFRPVKPIAEGDIALIVDGNLPRNCWPKGRVVGVVRAKDGQVRRATVQTAQGVFERPATKIAVLDIAGATGSKSSQ